MEKLEQLDSSSENKGEVMTKAREIALLGDYSMIVKELEQTSSESNHENLKEESIESTKRKFAGLLDERDFPSDNKKEKLWEMIAVMDLFDEELARHCLETYREAKAKIEKILYCEVSHEKFRIADFIEKEIDLERFYFACVAHDIGKISIPKEILNNQAKREDWDNMLIDMQKSGELSKGMLDRLGMGEDDFRSVDILAFLKKTGLKANQLVPLKKALKQEEIEKLEARGFSTEEPIMEHMKKHETESAAILEKEGFPIIAKIAGQHHNYSRKKLAFPVSTTTLHISNELSTIVRFADMQDALGSERSYKTRFSVLKTLRVLVEEAKKSETGLSPQIAYFWIKDEYKKISDKQSGDWDERELENVQVVQEFLDDTEKNGHLEKWLKEHGFD